MIVNGGGSFLGIVAHLPRAKQVADSTPRDPDWEKAIRARLGHPVLSIGWQCLVVRRKGI